MKSGDRVDIAIRHARVAGADGYVDILVHDGRIKSIMNHATEQADVDIDARGGLVSSGLVDAHIHLDKALTADRVPSGLVGDLRTRHGLEIAIRAAREIKRSFTVGDVRDRAVRVARMASQAGTTTMRTHVDVDPIVGLTGILGVLEAREACAGVVDIEIVAFPQEGVFRSPGTVELMREALRLGADVVGGAPALDDHAQDHVRFVFDLAREFGRPVDMHVDESDRREDFTLPFVIEEARRPGVPTVTVAHISSLSVQPEDVARSTIAALAETGIHVVVNPIIVKITRLRELLDAGVSVMFGSDNVRDPFYPLGTANPVDAALLACQIAALGSRQDLKRVFDAITLNPSRMLGLSGQQGVAEGTAADLVIFAGPTPADVVLERRLPTAVIKSGRVVAIRSDEAMQLNQVC